MVDRVKVKITEKNSQELDFTEEYDLTADNTFFDNTGTDLISDSTGEAIRELSTQIAQSASPGFSWGRSGNLSNNTWLRNEGVNSNRAGRTITFANPTITRIFISTENADTYTITVYEHEGDQINLTAITTLSSVSSRTADSGSISVPVTQGRQLAIRITSGSARNMVVGMTLAGENT